LGLCQSVEGFEAEPDDGVEDEDDDEDSEDDDDDSEEDDDAALSLFFEPLLFEPPLLPLA
jgi:hypothetical protein